MQRIFCEASPHINAQIKKTNHSNLVNYSMFTYQLFQTGKDCARLLGHIQKHTSSTDINQSAPLLTMFFVSDQVSNWQVSV